MLTADIFIVTRTVIDIVRRPTRHLTGDSLMITVRKFVTEARQR